MFIQEYPALYTQYSEAFSDLCMIFILQLQPDEYLEHIVSTYGSENFEANFTSELDYARLYAVLETCFGKPVWERLDKKYLRKNHIKQSSTLNTSQAAVSQLVRMSKYWSSPNMEDRCLIHAFDQLIEYLRKCMTVLESNPQSEAIHSLRAIYKAFSTPSTLQNYDIREIFCQCEEIVRQYTQTLQQFLEETI